MSTAGGTAGEHGPVVQIRGVTKTYGAAAAIQAVEDVSLDISSGEFVSILGPSGCGKSTLLNMVAGLMPPSQGSIRVLGRPVTGPVTQVGIVFQHHLLLPWRTIMNNVLLQIEVRRRPIAEYRPRAQALLEKVGLADFADRFPDELSGGMNQRAAICRALIHDPPLLLMDEPFGALDAMTRDQMVLDFHRLSRDEGMTVVFVTHSISEAVFLSDRVVIISPRPGRLRTIVPIELGHQRHLELRETPEFARYARTIREMFQDMGLLREERR